MAHKTLVNGTVYEVGGGKTLIGGTAYSIDKGKTLVGGTAYEVGFGPSTVLNDNNPATIQAVARAGQAANYWAVGDVVVITLNGTVGALTFSNKKCYAFIIGFDHNSTIEGSNTIHFQFGMSSLTSSRFISYCDSDYNNTGSSAGFRMNLSDTNLGGWKESYMRNTICPAFLSAMPSDWQSVIAACTKYSDNTGGGSNTASYVTATEDKIWLLSCFEMTGKTSSYFDNNAEQNYQQQYDYYKNGGSQIPYKHNGVTTKCYSWLRSVSAYNISTTTTDSFMYIRNGNDGHSKSSKSYGISPCFMVA